MIGATEGETNTPSREGIDELVIHEGGHMETAEVDACMMIEEHLYPHRTLLHWRGVKVKVKVIL